MDHRDIYAKHADDYDALVAAEDADGHLLPALVTALSPALADVATADELDADGESDALATAGALQRPQAGVRIVEVGAGTGRVTRLLARAGARVHATEPAPAMLGVARQRIGQHPRVILDQAEAEALPVLDDWADAAIAGWVFGHFRIWMPDTWQADLERALAEMSRVVRSGGSIVIVESLGTGSQTPKAPTPGLAEFHAWLESRGFTRTWIRTDFAFADVDTAARVTGFFFGDEFGERVRRERWRRVPECTGLWTARV